MTPEHQMWKTLSKAVGNLWDATRHEDSISRGVPDVSFAAWGRGGWLELKVLTKWPIRPDTIISLDHFTPQQKVWLWRRGLYGGNTWFLLRVLSKDEWLLYDYTRVREIGCLTQRQMRKKASWIWWDVPPKEQFVSLITRE